MTNDQNEPNGTEVRTRGQQGTPAQNWELRHFIGRTGMFYLFRRYPAPRAPRIPQDDDVKCRTHTGYRASVTTIPQAHHAVPGIVPHLNYSYIPIISNNTFITTRLPSIVHTNLSSSHRHTVPTIGQMNIDWIIVRLVRLRRSHFKKYRQSGSVMRCDSRTQRALLRCHGTILYCTIVLTPWGRTTE
jgi:hypothetical protein